MPLSGLPPKGQKKPKGGGMKRWPLKSLSWLVIYTIFLLVFISCQNKFSKYTYHDYKKLEEPSKKIKISSIPLITLGINYLGDFRIIDDYVVLIDYKSEDAIKIFDLKTRRLLKSFGKKGQGPAEFIQAAQIIPSPDSNKNFWVYDLPARTLKKFNIEKVLEGDIKPIKIINLKGKRVITLTITPEREILGLGFLKDARMLVFNMEGKLVKRIGKNPVKLKNERFAIQHSQGFWGQFVFLDKRKEIFLAVTKGSLIEQYDFKTGRLFSVYYGPEIFFPEYDIVQAGPFYTITPNKKTRYGYVGIAYNKLTDEIFLLYSGKYFFNKKGEPSSGARSNIIYVMNSAGILTKKLILDKEIYKFHMSEDGLFFYGSTTSNNKIIKFLYKLKWYRKRS